MAIFVSSGGGFGNGVLLDDSATSSSLRARGGLRGAAVVAELSDTAAPSGYYYSGALAEFTRPFLRAPALPADPFFGIVDQGDGLDLERMSRLLGEVGGRRLRRCIFVGATSFSVSISGLVWTDWLVGTDWTVDFGMDWDRGLFGLIWTDVSRSGSFCIFPPRARRGARIAPFLARIGSRLVHAQTLAAQQRFA